MKWNFEVDAHAFVFTGQQLEHLPGMAVVCVRYGDEEAHEWRPIRSVVAPNMATARVLPWWNENASCGTNHIGAFIRYGSFDEEDMKKWINSARREHDRP